ncbi:TPA: hypothetical protein LA460_002386 [Clostridium botulinum]|uniref:HEPN domain-containing protein n=1 Tax=Clostridium botulinum TaxID=1491 RepID=UPI000773307C|nr:HEPN domain-containing protein [Clostridium botulinum]NFL39749.1 hypothetical protein [Clostridium botulinum]NFL66703.1 hypothetical protein [Clostridium botulinum]NFN09612.1 hypothetical protein [Clostridium botulinum]NFN25970.1 hypothetical protein [Clostridium botulinum]NFN30666.1 hypothetical protein [Clostridium botulinum]
MKSSLRAEIDVRYNYKSDECLNNINIEIPFSNLSDMVTLIVKSIFNNSIIIEAEVFYEEPKCGDEDLKFFKTKENMLNFYKKLLLYEFEVRINDLFIALQIAQPARIDFLKIRLFQDEIESKPLYYEKLITPALASITIESNNRVHTVDFLEVWNWLIKQNDFWCEVPEDKIGIFLNYFRYFHYDSSPLAFMWISMALESILVTNNFQKSQLKGKLKVILKEQYSEAEIDRFVNSFYDLRSKIAHGKQRLFRPTLLHDALSTVGKVDKVFWENGEFGYVALISCIHMMIRTNRSNLEFKESIIYTLLD